MATRTELLEVFVDGKPEPRICAVTLETEADRSMDIRPSDTAMATQTHPLIRAHPETGRLGFFSCLGYIIGIRYAAVICLGAVVQGETLHHEYINTEVSRAIMQISLDTGVPVLFGVLTTMARVRSENAAAIRSRSSSSLPHIGA